MRKKKELCNYRQIYLFHSKGDITTIFLTTTTFLIYVTNYVVIADIDNVLLLSILWSLDPWQASQLVRVPSLVR